MPEKQQQQILHITAAVKIRVYKTDSVYLTSLVQKVWKTMPG